MRLLIAEDDALHRSFLRAAAQMAMGDVLHLVEEAGNGLEAMRMFDSCPFDCFIFDLQMPQATGVDAARYIWDKKPDARILFWSNYAEEAYVRGITRIVPAQAVYGYILKSASEERLQGAIKAVLVEEQCLIDREVRGVQQRAHDSKEGLSEPEFDALVDLALGLTDRAMASRRNLSLRSAQGRLQSLYAKLGLERDEVESGSGNSPFNSRTRAICLALERGLLTADLLKREEVRLQSTLNPAGRTKTRG